MVSPRLPSIELVLSSCWRHRVVAKRLSSTLTLASNSVKCTRFKLTPDQRPIIFSLSSFRTVSTSHFRSLSGEQDVKSLHDATLQPHTPTQAAQTEGMTNDVRNGLRR